jgi:hypothetical protein
VDILWSNASACFEGYVVQQEYFCYMVSCDVIRLDRFRKIFYDISLPQNTAEELRLGITSSLTSLKRLK